jgi:flagellar hook-associated protein 3 FlgL
MRVTSNTNTNLIISSSQLEQQQLATLQQQISTGNSVEVASDNPLAFQQASQTQVSLAQNDAYTKAADQANTLASQNNSAMTSIYTVMASVSETLAGVATNASASSMQTTATQLSSLLSQLTSVVNQKPNGTYIFGGTSNQPPIDTTTGTYNTATNGSTTSIEIQPGNSVQTGIVAGRPGTPPVNGFLYDSTTGVDVIASIKQAITDLNAGNASAVQTTDVQAINKAQDHISSYVGSTSATLSAVSTASTSLTQQAQSMTNLLNSLTQTNLPTASVQLAQIQNQYQATLEAGTRIMGLSILNYIGSVSTG